MRDHEGQPPGWRAPFQRAWSRLKSRCLASTGPRPRDRQLPRGLRPLVDFLERLPGEWQQYQARVR